MDAARIKLSAIWIARMLVGFLGDVLRFMEPGMMQQFLAGEVDGVQLTDGMLLGSAAFMVLPILMVVLSLTLKYKLNRWANISLAILLFAFDAVGLPTYTSAYAIFLIVIGLLFNVLTIWFAWKWRDPEAVRTIL